MNSVAKGRAGESIGVSYLKNLGFKIVERNFYAKNFGEIDIIAIKDDIWHFIEVKSAIEDFEPIYNISNKKLKRVINSVNYYLNYKNLDVIFSIDAIIVSNNRVEFLENITL
jgi:putative endonuclease